MRANRDAGTSCRHSVVLARGHHHLGSVLSETGKPAEGEAEFRQAIALRQKLADDNPADTEFRSHLAGSHNILGTLLGAMGKLPEAQAEHRTALALWFREPLTGLQIPGSLFPIWILCREPRRYPVPAGMDIVLNVVQA
jgi:Flp pilus assembly protein TadD